MFGNQDFFDICFKNFDPTASATAKIEDFGHGLTLILAIRNLVFCLMFLPIIDYEIPLFFPNLWTNCNESKSDQE